MRKTVRLTGAVAVIALAVAATGCGGDDDGNGTQSQPFTLQFAAVDGSNVVHCGDTMGGFGTSGTDSVEVSDFRLYVSNLRFDTTGGSSVSAKLDDNPFQYNDQNGSVALIDFTSTAAGACTGGVTYAEGTARTNTVITGTVAAKDIRGVRFDVGIPQRLMKTIIANHTAEDAPSPLAEMHWSWGFAYRFLVMNFVVADGSGAPGEGYVHVGSNDCGGDGTKALTDRDACGKPNAAAVALTSFDPAKNVVAVDVRELLAHLDFQVTPQDAPPVPGVECHSSSQQPDCATIFTNLGINQQTGSATAALNHVFKVR